jgi:Phosphotransferase enzyme family
MVRPDVLDEIAAVSSLCQELGLGSVAPSVLKTAHHTTLLLSPLSIVARVQSAEPSERTWRQANDEVALTRYLADRDAPALSPLDGLAGPHRTAASVVTLWPYVSHRRADEEIDTTLAATALASLHEALRHYAGDLPPYTYALDRCWAVLADDGASAALAHSDRDLLRTQYCRLRHVAEATKGDWGSLHGDVHLGNLLVGADGPVWVDFDNACLGPREYDVAGLPAEAWSHFGNVDPALTQTFADLKSVCVTVWCWADISRSPEIREAGEYHLNRVRNLARRSTS